MATTIASVTDMAASTLAPSYDVFVLQTVERLTIGCVYAIIISVGILINLGVILFGWQYANHYIREPFFILMVQFIPAGCLVLFAHLIVGVFTILWTGSTISLAGFQASTLAKAASTAEAVGMEALILLAVVVCFNRFAMTVKHLRHLFKGDRAVIWVILVWTAVLAHVVTGNLNQCFRQFNTTYFYFTYTCKDPIGTAQLIVRLNHVLLICGPLLGIFFAFVAYLQIRLTLRTREPTTSVSSTITLPLPRRITKLRRHQCFLKISITIAICLLPMEITYEVVRPFVTPAFYVTVAFLQNFTVLIAAIVAPMATFALDPYLRTELGRIGRILRCRKG